MKTFFFLFSFLLILILNHMCLHTHTRTTRTTQTHRPNVFIQFEDFSSDKAKFILDRYKDDRLCFNDDIQGTGAVCVAGAMAALTLQGKRISELGEQRFLIAGAGSAGLGVARKLAEAIVRCVRKHV
jgi:malic enzyme